jgi:hypothetical protein
MAISGFIIILGIILLSAFFLAILDNFDPSLFLNNEIQIILVYVLLILGIFDIVCGIALFFGE